MRGTLLCLVLISARSWAGELEVPLGERAALKPGRSVNEIIVRDPSLLNVVVVDGVVFLEGVKHGVTGVTIFWSDGELERLLVVVGNATNSKGARKERAQAIDLKRSAAAQAKAPAAAAKPQAKERASIQEASDAVRAAAEAL